MTTVLDLPSNIAAKDAAAIPYVTPEEAEKLGREALQRLLVLLDVLGPEDWSMPTACTLWNVRDMVAHQAGSYASGTGYGEMLHQYVVLPKRGQLMEDSINARQLADRAGKTPAELIAELRAVGDKAVVNWAHGFRAFKLLGIPHPVPGWLSVRHLMLVTHSRDTWMHRLDICRATGRPFVMTPEHDGRINELVVCDLAKTLRRRLGGRSIVLELTGIAGAKWTIGPGEPEATIAMDTLDFNIYASGRMSFEQAVGQASFSGNAELAHRTFRDFLVLY
jgi:uncharacterized protein (TIGR03083 family)